MDAIITPHPLEGSIGAVASKSVAHRLLILAALAEGATDLACNTTSQDIEATVGCLNSLGAEITREGDILHVVPIGADDAHQLRKGALLDCGESGSTLRFLLPVACALGADARFTGHGRLAQRPLAPLDEQLEYHGVTLSGVGSFPLSCAGTLTGGHFVLPGNVSSQYVTGLLMAAPLLSGPVDIYVSEPVESRPYIDLTIRALALFGVTVSIDHPIGPDRQPYIHYALAPAASSLRSPGTAVVEGDWSNAAFWLAAGALGGSGIAVTGLDLASAQGDRGILGALAALGAEVGRQRDTALVTHDRLEGRPLNMAAIPDLVMPLAAVCAYADGTSILTGTARLRLKESDRVQSVTDALGALGCSITSDADSMTIEGVGAGARPEDPATGTAAPSGRLHGGEIDAAGDHRIAMMGAIAAAWASGPTVIHGAECVAKSYPGFFEDFQSLGGTVELREA